MLQLFEQLIQERDIPPDLKSRLKLLENMYAAKVKKCSELEIRNNALAAAFQETLVRAHKAEAELTHLRAASYAKHIGNHYSSSALTRASTRFDPAFKAPDLK